MQPRKYEYQSDFARRYFGEGQAEGRLHEARATLLALAVRHGAVSDELRARVLACVDPERLRALTVEVAGAADHAAIEGVLAGLPPAAVRDD
jgi:hypothetical protein